MSHSLEPAPKQFFAIYRDGRIVTRGNTVGSTCGYLEKLAVHHHGELRYADEPFPFFQPEVGKILGHTWEQIQRMQQGQRPYEE